MSDPIRFLETLGKTPALTPDQLDELIRAQSLDPATREALLAGDEAALARLMGGRGRMSPTQYPPGEGDRPARRREEEPERRDDDKPEPDDDDKAD